MYNQLPTCFLSWARSFDIFCGTGQASTSQPSDYPACERKRQVI